MDKKDFEVSKILVSMAYVCFGSVMVTLYELLQHKKKSVEAILV